MADTNGVKIPVWFWIISGLALLWNLYGVFQAYTTSFATAQSLQPYIDKGTMTADYAGFILTLPLWVKGVFWLSTVCGALGAFCLLLRKSIAVLLFVISLVSIFLMYLYNFVLSGKAELLTNFDYIITAAVTLIAMFMLWFTLRRKAKGWLT